MVPKRCAPIVLSVMLLVCGTRSTLAGPITFLTALPVAKSHAVIRGQYLLIRASDDPTPADRHLDLTAFVTDETVAPGHRFSIVLDITPKAGIRVIALGQHRYRVVALNLELSDNLRTYRVSYLQGTTGWP